MNPLRIIRRAKPSPGTYVSRPVLNGDEWEAWAKKHGVPEPVPAAEMHVTVLYSTTPVLTPSDGTVYSVATRSSYNPVAFTMFGPNEDALVVTWDDYILWARNWALLDLGATSTFATYRPHMTLSYSAADFDLPPEALADCPLLINLGPEVFEPLDQGDPDEETDEGDAEDGDRDTLVIVVELAKKEAASVLQDVVAKSNTGQASDISPLDRMALRDIAAGKSLTVGVARRVAKSAWATPALKALTPAQRARAQAVSAQSEISERYGLKTRETSIKFSGENTDIAKKVREKLGANTVIARKSVTLEEDRIVFGVASVSTIDGELIRDHHGARITTKCLEEFGHSLIRGTRAGLFEHEGEQVSECVELMMFDQHTQAALGLDLGMEFLAVKMHLLTDSAWEEAKDGDWEMSIAGTLYYKEDEAS